MFPHTRSRPEAAARPLWHDPLALSLGLKELRLYTSVHLAENVKLSERIGYKVDREAASPHLGVFVYMSKRL